MRRQISISVLLAALIASLTSGPANAVDTRTCAQGGTCAVGDVGPGGGVVFYARTSGDFSDSYTFTWQFMDIPQTNVVTVSLGSTDVSGLQFDYLESAPSSGIVTRPQASADGATGTSFALGAGQANTNLFKQQFPSDTSLNNASLYADNYSNNGLGDWFLPSVDELALLSIRHLNNELGANDPFSQTNIFFWSSSAMENFLKDDSGLTKNYGMNSPATNSVIPIRAFSSTPAPVPTTTPTPTPTPTTSAAPVVTTPAKVSASSKIKFDRSSSVLTKASKAKLKKLAKTVGADAEIKVQAAVGPLNNASKAQMRALAKLRAKAIAKYLKSQISMNQTYKIKIIDEGIKPVTSVTAN
jgi:outer membrane protein OmpA-like peptidoglycan-associated protein